MSCVVWHRVMLDVDLVDDEPVTLIVESRWSGDCGHEIWCVEP
jgi:hypothetical protein